MKLVEGGVGEGGEREGVGSGNLFEFETRPWSAGQTL